LIIRDGVAWHPRSLALSGHGDDGVRPLNTVDETRVVHPKNDIVDLLSLVPSRIGLQILNNIGAPGPTVTIELMNDFQTEAADALLIALGTASECCGEKLLKPLRIGVAL